MSDTETLNEKTLQEEFLELNDMVNKGVASSSPMVKAMIKKSIPIKRIMTFIHRIVVSLEKQRKTNEFLIEEFQKINSELSVQSSIVLALGREKLNEENKTGIRKQRK